MQNGPFDLNDLLLDTPVSRLGKVPRKQPARRRFKGDFIGRPIPVKWLSRCILLGFPAVKLGLTLWFLRSLQRKDTVALTGKARSLFWVSPWRMGDALRRMEAEGLIEIVSLVRGRAPVVTVLLEEYYE